MSESRFIGKEQCPSCGSRDNLARYSDGHATCFTPGCDHWEPPTGATKRMSVEERPKKSLGLIETQPAGALGARLLTEETVRKFGYGIGSYKGKPCQISNYFVDGKIKAQHIRTPDKEFIWTGEKKRLPLFGQWVWPEGGKILVITEGQIDAMSVSQAQQNKWPVVSINSGCKGGAQDIRDNIGFVESFDKVIFMFDMDEPGQLAATECASLLSPGKAYIARLPLKDANECLKAHRTKEIVDAIWQAKEYRPDGIIAVDDLNVDELLADVDPGYPLKYPGLQEKYQGVRKRELVLITAGSGVGKSTLAREVMYDLCVNQNLKVGAIYLEESVKKTFRSMAAIRYNVPLGTLMINPKALSREQYLETQQQLLGKMYFYDHFGSLESDSLMDKFNYLAVGMQVDFIFLDHISMVVSDQEGSGEGERKDLDRLMTKLRAFVERTGVGIIAIVHLKRPSGGRKSFNEGGKISLQDLRGSAALEQLSDAIWAVERDQQGEDPNVATLRALKNRMFGDLGEAGDVKYYKDTGRLLPYSGFEGSDDDFSNQDRNPEGLSDSEMPRF